ncbi:hypothetical protein D3C86_1685880 [compost metagenome]
MAIGQHRYREARGHLLIQKVQEGRPIRVDGQGGTKLSIVVHEVAALLGELKPDLSLGVSNRERARFEFAIGEFRFEALNALQELLDGGRHGGFLLCHSISPRQDEMRCFHMSSLTAM